MIKFVIVLIDTIVMIIFMLLTIEKRSQQLFVFSATFLFCFVYSQNLISCIDFDCGLFFSI